VRGGGDGGLVPGAGIAVHRVDASGPADDLRERHAHVAAAGADVHAPPAFAQPETVEGGGERAAVDVVAEAELDHPWGKLPGVFRDGGSIRV
jgi:hypothetical protein